MARLPLAYRIFPFLPWMKTMTKKDFVDDFRAGITGMMISIPQAVAFAAIAGMPPEFGFYSAIIIPIIAGLFGSSFHLISGPTTAISIVIFTTVSKFADAESNLEMYIQLTLILTIMVGVMQLLMGLFRAGKLVNFVSHSVILGFTAGAGVLVAVKQLKHVFGVDVPAGSGVVSIIQYIYEHIGQTNIYIFVVAMATLFSALIIKRFLPKYYMLLAMIIGSVVAYKLGGEAKGIELVSQIPSSMPGFEVPNITNDIFFELLNGAFVLAVLGAVEAVAISKSIALQTHQKIDNNQEFIGQGLSNFVGGFFSCFVGSGSFSRSGVNHQSGGATPLSGVFAALFLLVVMVFFGGLAGYLPKAAMGGIILLVGYNLIDFKHIKKVIQSCGFPQRFPRSWSEFMSFLKGKELNVFLLTMLGTIFFRDLEYALILGVLLSFVYYIDKTSKPYIASLGKTPEGKYINMIRDETACENKDFKVIRIDGSLYFGAIERVSDFFLELYETDYKKVLIIASGINFIDLTGAEWLEHEAQKWKDKGGGLYFYSLNKVAQDVLINSGIKERIGEERFSMDKKEILARVNE